jgi:hypothetical protein
MYMNSLFEEKISVLRQEEDCLTTFYIYKSGNLYSASVTKVVFIHYFPFNLKLDKHCLCLNKVILKQAKLTSHLYIYNHSLINSAE